MLLLRRIGRLLAALVACLTVAGCLWLNSYQHDLFMRRVPSGPEVRDIAVIADSGSVWGSCGAVIYRLDPKTSYALGPHTPGSIATSLEPPWAETPIPARASGDAGPGRRFPIGLGCGAGIREPQQRQIADAASRPGSFFYPGHDRDVFILMPREHLLVYSYFD